jgi:superfamily II DNA or RNA helicase
MVIIDETHNVKAEQYQEALRSNVFRYRFGFSATPLDPKPMAKWKNAQVKMWLGGIIHTVNPEELLDNGTVAKPTIHMWEITKPILDDGMQWQAAENHGIVKNIYRNKIIAHLANSLEGQKLLLCKRIEQGEELQKMIPNSIFLFGNIDDKIRQDVVNRFDAGEDFVLIASTIFDEGISIDSINHVILAGGGASFVKILQRVGRGMRLLKNKKGEIIKNTVDIHDFFDDTHRILRKHSKDRAKIYYDYGYKNIIEHDKKEIEAL